MSVLQVDEKAVFNAARQIGDAAARESYLKAACRGDAEVLRRIRELLRLHEVERSFLEYPAGAAFMPAAPAPPLESAGSVIGPYKLLEQIGEGGFGVVFMAEQAHPVRRKVALKVLKPGMDTRQVVARFEAERQALALMDHPNIARVLDAGATETGRPYFVMELVRGVPITEYCDAHHLTPVRRLELFVTVCHAVQHAHQKGIIHRDIKPSNVLVALHDDRPVSKVIDFGIAKATSGPLTDKTAFTAFAQLIGTPLYMSPEQASMNALDVDTRSDIYSLGVLLYELLTGATPFDGARLKEAALDEVRRIIREEEPAKPSTRLSTDGGLPALAVNRGTEPAKLAGLVRGELDWIVMKALEKDRSRRYATANGLAVDVQRYLSDEAVSACPPSVGYRLRKLARRNRRALAVASLLGAMLLVVAGGLGWIARDRAARHGRDAEAVALLLGQCEEALLADAPDRAAIALEAAERRVADGGAGDLGDRLARNRADLALLRELDAIDIFGWTWANDAHPAGEALAARWRAALADYGVLPDESRAEEGALRLKGTPVRDRALTALDRWLVAERSPGVRALLRAADPEPYRDAVRDALVAGDSRALGALAARPEALAQPTRFAAVLGTLEDAPVERRRTVMEAAVRRRPGDLTLLMTLAQSYVRGAKPQSGPPVAASQADNERGVRWYQAAVTAQPRNVAALNNLGYALWARGDPQGGLACYEEAVRIDPTFARGYYNLGVVLGERGETDRAIACYRDAIRLNPDGADAHFNLGHVLWRRGDLDACIACFEQAIRLDPDASRHYDLGIALRQRGDLDGAVAACRKAIGMRPDYAEAHCNLGTFLTELGRFREALESLRTGHDLGTRRADWRHPSARWMQEAERLLALEARLGDALSGGAAGAAELLDLADLCHRFKGRHADAVLLYGRAFEAEPGLAEVPNGRCYDAARAAALAAAGKDIGAVESARLRGLALDWLRAELAVHRTDRDPGTASAPAGWIEDAALASVRDPRDLAALPDAERERWTELWNEVRSLAARTAKK